MRTLEGYSRTPGPKPDTDLDKMSVPQLADLVLHPPDPESLRGQLEQYSQGVRVQVTTPPLHRLQAPGGVVEVRPTAVTIGGVRLKRR